MQPEQKKKKKRITPELIAGPGSGAQAMGPQMGAPAPVEAVKSKKQKTGSSTGYLRSSPKGNLFGPVQNVRAEAQSTL